MAGEETGVLNEEASSGSWPGLLASAGALIAAALLAALLLMVSQSNSARDAALASERHSYDVMLLTRTVDGTVARAESALSRYVMDGSRRPARSIITSGSSPASRSSSSAASSPI